MSSSLRPRLAGILMLIAFIGTAASGRAQTTATVVGSAHDTTGESLPGVQVTLRQPATGVSRGTTTDDQGRFVIAGLSAGSYELRAELLGFSPLSRTAIEVSVG